MAYLADFTTQLIDAVSAQGLACCREYQSVDMGSYGNRPFATAAVEQLRFYDPIPLPEGSALPLTMQMRVRFCAAPDAHEDSAEIFCDTYLLPALMQTGWQLRGMTADAAVFEKEIGRICTVCHLTIEAVVMQQSDAADTENSEEVAAQ